MKGATPESEEQPSDLDISIHAPVKGATASVSFLSFDNINFNPRSREGSDVVGAASRHVADGISIHAPVKGATPPLLNFCTENKNFNPRSREGSDLYAVVFDTQGTAISIHAPVKGAT